MFRMSISQKFIIYLIGISFIPLLVVGIVSSRISEQILQEEASHFTAEIVHDQQEYLDLQLRQVENLIANLSGVGDIRVVIENSEAESTFSTLNAQAQIGNILNSYSNIDGLVSIDIFTIAGAQFHVGDTLDISNTRTEIQNQIFDEALASEQFVTWIGIEDNVNGNSSHEKVVTAARVLYEFDRENLRDVPIALVIVNYSIDTLYEHFSNIDLGENAYMLVLDKHDHFIYHPDPTLQGETASEDLLSVLSTANSEPIAIVDDVKVSISVTQSQVSGWTIVSLVPIATLNAKALPIQQAIVFILLVSFIAVAIIAWFYNRSVVIPIRKITYKYQMIQQNAISPENHHVTVQGNDEIAELGLWFNTFIDTLATKERNEEVLRENLAITRVLYETSNQIIDVKHLSTLLGKIAENFVEALSANRVSLILLDLETDSIEHYHKAGPGVDNIESVTFEELSMGLSGWVLRKGVPALSPKDEIDLRENPEVQKRRRETNCGSIIVAPLKYGGKIHGTVTAINRPQDPDFTQEDVVLMMALINQATIAIENAQLVQSLKESEEKFFKALHAIPDPMAINSIKDERYIEVNDSFLKMMQYTREEVIGHTPDELNVWSKKEHEKQYVRELFKNGIVRNFETTFRTKSGSNSWLALVSAEIVELEGESCIITVAKDISEIREMEQQRIQFAVERERVQILSDFITEASHEFRTPLAIINTNSYLLKKMSNSEKQQGRLETIQNQVQVITTLVDSLSLMAKIDGGGYQFQHASFDLNTLVYSLQQVFEEEIQEKFISLTSNLSDETLIFKGDQAFLVLAIQNCLENAIQYTKRNGSISLRTTKQDDVAVIEIKDSGIGIKEDDLLHIFRRFYQVDKSGKVRGFGLGLPITKSIVEHYGGRIEAESVIGMGSTFRLYLPLRDI